MHQHRLRQPFSTPYYCCCRSLFARFCLYVVIASGTEDALVE